MFGEKMLVGHYDITVDNKHRIMLPASTKREKDDEVFLVYDKDISEYLLLSEKAMEKKISELEELVSNARTEQEIRAAKLLLYRFYEGVLRKCHVDSSGRITLSDYFKSDNTITAIGANDHLVLKIKKDYKV